MSEKNRTVVGGVETSEGFIPHIHAKGVDYPIRVYRMSRGHSGPPVPETLDGKHMYAVPGGGRISEHDLLNFAYSP